MIDQNIRASDRHSQIQIQIQAKIQIQVKIQIQNTNTNTNRTESMKRVETSRWRQFLDRPENREQVTGTLKYKSKASDKHSPFGHLIVKF